MNFHLRSCYNDVSDYAEVFPSERTDEYRSRKDRGRTEGAVSEGLSWQAYEKI